MSLPNETSSFEWWHGDYFLSTDRDRLDLEVVHRFLAEESYWARGISPRLIRRAIDGSITVGVYHGASQVGFARIVTDCARIAYLMDVFIDAAHRGKGLGASLATVIRDHPDLADVSRWLLATRDAHSVYERAGWHQVRQPEWLMEVTRTDAASQAVAGVATEQGSYRG